MAPQSDDRPSGSSLPGTRADGSASAVEEAAAWLERTTGERPRVGDRPPGQGEAVGVGEQPGHDQPTDFDRQSRRDERARRGGSRPRRGRARTRRGEQRREDAPYAEDLPPDASADLAPAAPPDDPPDSAPDAPPDDPVLLGPDADAEEVARKILLDQLTGQARSRSELAAKLAKRRVPDEVAERLLNRFEEVGLVDDAAFARAWVESRQPGKGLGRRALAQELRRKGIDDEVARAALDEVEHEDEEAAARALVRRKLRTMRGVDRVTATRRLAGMLARKGHGGDVVWRVVREELDALEVPEGADDPADAADLP